MSIDYNLIIACAAIATMFIAIIAILLESKRSRFSLGVDSILKLYSQFNSVDFRKIRKKAATLLLSEDSTEKPEIVAVDGILNFFEMVAFLTRRGALDDEVVWNIFFYWMHGWRHCAKDRIEMVRKSDPTLWADFIGLYEGRLLKIEKHERQLSHLDVSLSKEKLQEFLKGESNL